MRFCRNCKLNVNWMYIFNIKVQVLKNVTVLQIKALST